MASLRRTCVHCGRFSTAAIRRCPGSVSVPVVGAALSRPLDVFGLVSRYLTNNLVSRRPLGRRNYTLWFSPSRRNVARDYRGFPRAIPVRPAGHRRLTTPFAAARDSEESLAARLACLIHATSVHSEPGSNPSSDLAPKPSRRKAPTKTRVFDPPRPSKRSPARVRSGGRRARVIGSVRMVRHGPL